MSTRNLSKEIPNYSSMVGFFSVTPTASTISPSLPHTVKPTFPASPEPSRTCQSKTKVDVGKERITYVLMAVLLYSQCIHFSLLLTGLADQGSRDQAPPPAPPTALQLASIESDVFEVGNFVSHRTADKQVINIGVGLSGFKAVLFQLHWNNYIEYSTQ